MQPLQITLRGITNDGVDPSVDTWRAVTFPLMRHVTGVEGGFELKIMRRGAAPKVRGRHVTRSNPLGCWIRAGPRVPRRICRGHKLLRFCAGLRLAGYLPTRDPYGEDLSAALVSVTVPF